MLMRVSIGIHLGDIERVLETYNLLSQRFFTHATPTLFNAGTPNPQMSSCFPICVKEDSIDGIYEIAVCNLTSISLSKFVTPADNFGGAGHFDLDNLRYIAKVVTKNLNRVINRNFYPVEEARRSNTRHRPIGIGVQGLAVAFQMMKLLFENEEARRLNKEVFETIYFSACEASMELAVEEGSYETYAGSPASAGRLQFDLLNVVPSDRWDWAGLKEKIAVLGMHNSLLLAPMPTASTAQVLGNNESTEPFTSNMFNRQ